MSAALRTTARQVSPDTRPSRASLRSALAWTALTATVLAGAGAVGAMVWRRYRVAMAAEAEPEATAHGAADKEAPPAEDTSSENGTAPAKPHQAKSTS